MKIEVKECARRRANEAGRYRGTTVTKPASASELPMSLNSDRRAQGVEMSPTLEAAVVK